MKKYKWHEWDINEFKQLSKFNKDPTKQLIHNRMGRLYWVWREDLMYIQRFARENGPYQGRNLKFLRAICPQARTVVDVGMNIGSNTMEYATWAQTVQGFEPFPETYDLAQANIELNQNVELRGRYWNSKRQQTEHQPDHADGWFKYPTKAFASMAITADIQLHNCALGAAAAQLQMEHHVNNAGQNCILSDSRRDSTQYRLHTVRVDTLDSFDLADVDIIKLDCEGYELPVLHGALNTIQKYRPIMQIEITLPQCRKYGYHPDDIGKFFQAIGNYEIFDFRGKKLPQEWNQIKGVIDRFFIPAERAHMVQEDLSDRKHPGMGKQGFGKKKKLLAVADSIGPVTFGNGLFEVAYKHNK
mgnify:CR=1 FL=1|jgi:FkbM family methyltransferase